MLFSTFHRVNWLEYNCWVRSFLKYIAWPSCDGNARAWQMITTRFSFIWTALAQNHRFYYSAIASCSIVLVIPGSKYLLCHADIFDIELEVFMVLISIESSVVHHAWSSPGSYHDDALLLYFFAVIYFCLRVCHWTDNFSPSPDLKIIWVY